MAKKPFIPPFLPPKIDFTPLIGEIVKARDVVARYDEAVKRLPNPEIIQRTFETKEAVLSSKIEGTQATLDEVMMFDAQDTQSEVNDKERDYREIVNYRLAITRGREILEKRPLSENLIKDLHRILLDSVRGQGKAPGEFRRGQVYIGPYGASIEEATFVPPEPQHIVDLFSNLEKYLNGDEAVDPLVQVAVAHYQFETIHPFMDGNGRVGRLLIPLFLYEKKVTAYPNIYISEFLEDNRDDYYALLRNVSERGEWIPWIRFFLRAIGEQTRLTLGRVTKIEDLHRRLKERMPEINSIYANACLDVMFVQPRFTVQTMRRLAKIPNSQTVYTLIDKFQRAGIIVDATPERARNKVFALMDLFRIIR